VKKYLIVSAWIAVVVCAIVPHRLQAQGTARTSHPRLTAWMTATNYLGIDNFECDCTLSFDSRTTARSFTFRSEPVVLGVRRDSPSDGLLQRGDVITHVDGRSITTAEGGRRFAAISPGDEVDLTIKRNGRTMKVSLRASEGVSTAYTLSPRAPGSYSSSWETPPVPRSPEAAAPPVIVWTPAPEPPQAAMPAQPALPPQPSPSISPVPARPATPATPPVIAYSMAWPEVPVMPAVPSMPRGWFGFSIKCNGCGWTSTSPSSDPVWESEEVPQISRIETGSPADRAGFRNGDRITHIDGYSILSREGARRFGRVRPGETIKLRVMRSGRTIERSLTVGTRPEVRAAQAARSTGVIARTIAPGARRPLRYSGKMDNVTVEVWSPGGPTVDKVGDTMVITVGTSVVRIKVDPRK
jgi:membrane-associated protease RseP (regulator of RpoE activity)